MTTVEHEKQVEEVCEEVSNVLDRLMVEGDIRSDIELKRISMEALSRTMTYVASTLGKDHLPQIERYLIANTKQMIGDVRAIVAMDS